MPSTLGALLGLYGLDPTTGRTQETPASRFGRI
jgi:hypothetical protein